MKNAVDLLMARAVALERAKIVAELTQPTAWLLGPFGNRTGSPCGMQPRHCDRRPHLLLQAYAFLTALKKFSRCRPHFVAGDTSKADGSRTLVEVPNHGSWSKLHECRRLNVMFLKRGREWACIAGHEIPKSNLTTRERPLANMRNRSIRRLPIRDPFANARLGPGSCSAAWPQPLAAKLRT